MKSFKMSKHGRSPLTVSGKDSSSKVYFFKVLRVSGERTPCSERSIEMLKCRSMSSSKQPLTKFVVSRFISEVDLMRAFNVSTRLLSDLFSFFSCFS